jgi:DNA-binding NtrC family response regulator
MSKPDILVVDDDIVLCRMLQRMLSEEQYNVEISQSMTDALAAIEKKPFDLYVMDFKLLEGGGIDIAKQIRSKGSKAPIILISGYHQSAVALRAKNLNISDCLAKPFSRATLSNAVKKAIGSPPVTVDPGMSRTKPSEISFLKSALRAITRLSSSISTGQVDKTPLVQDDHFGKPEPPREPDHGRGS